MNKYSAVIFDLDGTIVDNEEIWRKAFQKVATQNNIQYTKFNIQWPIPGRALADSWKAVGQEENAMVLAIETRAQFLELIETETVFEARPGFFNLTSYLKEKGYVLGLCTSSYWEIVDAELDRLGISGVFDAITTGEEVLRVKPDPEIYLLTCQKLGAEPEEATVYEDADAGVEAAETAGCRVFRVGKDFDFESQLEIWRKEETE